MESSSQITDNANTNPQSSAVQSAYNVTSLGQESEAKRQKNSTNSYKFVKNEPLEYKIHEWSSCNSNYPPENELKDCPKDQSSCWSSENQNSLQYIILKLRQPAVVRKIKFGKCKKLHKSNVKKFKIYGGLYAGYKEMDLLLEGSLHNDETPEVFNLQSDDCDISPILFLKIVPLEAWYSHLKYSIWRIELLGEDDPRYTNQRLRCHNELREDKIIRLCLKHFREQGYNDAFKALQKETGIVFEDPKFTELHKHLVLNGDFANTEIFITQCVNENLMDKYIKELDYKHAWHKQLSPESRHPGDRGGHQMVVDSQKSLIYLFGGYNGVEDLSDLWVYDIHNCSWTELFKHSEQFNGPTPRSCHKMVFDPVSESIFVLGRYISNADRLAEICLKSDFFVYNTVTQSWSQICDDTSEVGGPKIMYDHQMCLDVDKHTLYVFGGRILTQYGVPVDSSYSGLYSYNIATNTWKHIELHAANGVNISANVFSSSPRFTHSMLFHKKNRKLYIYGGKNNQEDLIDFVTLDVDNASVDVLKSNPSRTKELSCRGCKKHNNFLLDKKNPPSTYGCRATIDCERDEIYILLNTCDMRKPHEVLETNEFRNSLWVYSIMTKTWSKIYSCRYDYVKSIGINEDKSNVVEPCPRYAHQFVYDDHSKHHYLFGGNPGIFSNSHIRLNDFWMLDLYKPTRQQILMDCRYLLRKLHYEELTKYNFGKAMKFLRTDMAEVIDHDNQEQLENFHRLASLLFKTEDDENSDFSLTGKEGETKDDAQDTGDVSIELGEGTSPGISVISYSHYRELGGKLSRDEFFRKVRSKRYCLFNKLVKMMYSSNAQPDCNLRDFV